MNDQRYLTDLQRDAKRELLRRRLGVIAAIFAAAAAAAYVTGFEIEHANADCIGMNMNIARVDPRSLLDDALRDDSNLTLRPPVSDPARD